MALFFRFWERYNRMVDIYRINPVVLFVYFFSIVIISMFTNNIFISSASIIASLLYYSILQIKLEKMFVVSSILVFITVIVLNILWNHRGTTFLFFINNQPITFESLYYGLCIGLMILSSIFWFRLISKIFTSDKLLYIFNKISPKMALLLTICIRFADMYIEKFKSIDEAVKGIGYYKDYSIIDIIEIKCFVFSALVTWALENGIITSDSMVSRGFGFYKRTSYYVFKWTYQDKIMLFFIILIDTLNIIYIYKGYLKVVFYPTIIIDLNILNFIPFIILLIFILILIIVWRIKWHYMMLKI